MKKIYTAKINTLSLASLAELITALSYKKQTAFAKLAGKLTTRVLR